jgi:hypothetical protein
VELLASGEPEETEYLSDDEPDKQARAPRRPVAQRLRNGAPLVVALTLGVVLGGVATAGWRDREQQGLAASPVSLGLTFEQAIPAYLEHPTSHHARTVRVYLVVQNRSPGRVRVDSVQPVTRRGLERAVVHAWRPHHLAPAETVRVRLDVSPDCDDGPAVSMPALRLSVTPGRGGRRHVQVQPAAEPWGPGPGQPPDTSYRGVMTAQCEFYTATEGKGGLHLHLSSLELVRGSGRTATLLVLVGLSADGRPRLAGSVTAAELTVPGVRVGQPTTPVPLTAAGGAVGTALVIPLVVDRCAVALGDGRPRLDVTATAGPHVVTLARYDANPLELLLLRYVIEVCR